MRKEVLVSSDKRGVIIEEYRTRIYVDAEEVLDLIRALYEALEKVEI